MKRARCARTSWTFCRKTCSPSRSDDMRRQARCWIAVSVVFPTILSGLVCGILLACIAGVIHDESFRRRMHPSSVQLFSSMLSVGGLLGSYCLANSVSSYFGRRFCLTLGASIVLVTSVSIVAFDVGMFVLASRLGAGIGLGLLAQTTPVFAAETAPANFRAGTMASFELALSVGIWATYRLTRDEFIGIDHVADPDPDGRLWKTLILFPGAPAFFLVLATVTYVPNSPRFLVLKGRVAEARKVLLGFEVAPENEDKISSPGIGERVEVLLCAIQKDATDRKTDESSIPIRSPKAAMPRAVAVAVVLMALQVLVGIDIVTVFGLWSMRRLGLGERESLNFLVATGTAHVVAGIVAVPLIDVVGRKSILLFGSASMTVCFGLLTFSNEYVAGILLVVYSLCFSLTWGPCAVIVATEILPLKVRSRGIALAVAANFLSGAFVTGTFLSFADFFGLRWTFGLYASICALSFGFVEHFVPSTTADELERCVVVDEDDRRR